MPKRKSKKSVAESELELAKHSLNEMERDYRESREYVEGRNAYHAGISHKRNPHRKSGTFSKTAWYVGFFDSRTYDSLKHVFHKWKLNWPHD